MSNVERQRRWMGKNRALHNFRRRKKKTVWKGDLGVVAEDLAKELEKHPVDHGNLPVPVMGVKELRKLIKESHEVEHDPKPTIFRDDYGRVISERQWNLLRKKKEAAKEGGYEIDEWSQ